MCDQWKIKELTHHPPRTLVKEEEEEKEEGNKEMCWKIEE